MHPRHRLVRLSRHDDISFLLGSVLQALYFIQPCKRDERFVLYSEGNRLSCLWSNNAAAISGIGCNDDRLSAQRWPGLLLDGCKARI
jgi:hypothetical protein